MPKPLAILLLLALPACQPLIRQPGPEASYLADLPPAELREILSQLARAHEQKLQLVFYVSLPWVGTDAEARPFFATMAKTQGDLNQELKAWAKSHDIDLAFRFSDDILGKAQQTMEDRQQNALTSDDRPNRTRDALIQMFFDYEWQISILQTLLPKTRDPELKSYLQHSLKIHREGSAELSALLKKFKPA
jgi:hypothetical protein